MSPTQPDESNPKGNAPQRPSEAATEAIPVPSLDLLFDVELEATIRFGGRNLLLRDILSMTPGSVIELDKGIDEPAELLVAGRLIAKGEVVVVDGNFGLRVTELVNTTDRAGQLQ